jgi:hypothetical protein
MAATVTTPAFDAVTTTPRALLDDLDFVLGGTQRQKLTIHGNPGQTGVVDVMQGISQGHFAMAMVMPVGFTIGGDMRQLEGGHISGHMRQQGLRQGFATIK